MGALGIPASKINDDVWDYIFQDAPYDPSKMKIEEAKLSQMRNEFLYWYPIDMRASGKDLIQNHLTYYLFNHVIIWKNKPELWPKSVRANGHLLLNREKMSKNTGNFLTLYESIERFSADGMRLSLADAGDGVEDANFEIDMAEAGILRLHAFLVWVNEMVAMREKNMLRVDGETFADRTFNNEMNRLIQLAAQNYEDTFYKDALKNAFFEYQIARDNYKLLCGKDSELRQDLIMRFIETQALILSPICPHICERIWKIIGKDGLIVKAKWPAPDAVDPILVQESDFLHHAVKEFRARRENKINPKKGKDKKAPAAVAPPTEATVYVAAKYPKWKADIINILRKLYEDNGNAFPDNRAISQQVSSISKDAMSFAKVIIDKVNSAGGAFNVTEGSEFDQQKVLECTRDYILSTLQLEKLTILDATDASAPEDVKKTTSPGAPIIMYELNRGE